MKASKILDAVRAAVHRPSTSRRGFVLFRTFTRTMSIYQGLLTLAFVVLVALLFRHFLVTFQEVTLVVTEADEELVAMLDTFVKDGLVWLFVLVGIYTICTTLLTVSGARYLQEQRPPSTEQHEPSL